MCSEETKAIFAMVEQEVDGYIGVGIARAIDKILKRLHGRFADLDSEECRQIRSACMDNIFNTITVIEENVTETIATHLGAEE